MATTVAAGAQDAARINEHDAITAVLELYMDGCAQGDAEKLRRAFHADARMFGSVGGTRFDVAIADMIQMAEQAPADAGGSYRGRIVSVARCGDAATAVLAEDGFWGTVSFVDFFNLARIDGRWQIVNKTFAHTGGALPAP
jgi:putative lumazine-binding protein